MVHIGEIALFNFWFESSFWVLVSVYSVVSLCCWQVSKSGWNIWRKKTFFFPLKDMELGMINHMEFNGGFMSRIGIEMKFFLLITMYVPGQLIPNLTNPTVPYINWATLRLEMKIVFMLWFLLSMEIGIGIAETLESCQLTLILGFIDQSVDWSYWEFFWFVRWMTQKQSMSNFGFFLDACFTLCFH